MARQTGDIKVVGTIEGLSFYKMRETYFVRTKSSLTGKRFWKEQAFEGSRKSCSLLAKASALTASFYKSYPKDKKTRGLFNTMTGKVKLWLKEGRTEAQALLLLTDTYPVVQKALQQKKNCRRTKKAFAISKEKKLFSVLFYKNMPCCKRRRKATRLYYLKE
jgi:hypothetical protein